MKYQKVDKVPGLNFWYEDMQLFALVPDDEKGAVWGAIMAYFDAARVRDAGEERPNMPDLKSAISRAFYDQLTEKIEHDFFKYWRKCERNKTNRNTTLLPSVDERSTTGRPMDINVNTNAPSTQGFTSFLPSVDQWSTSGRPLVATKLNPTKPNPTTTKTIASSPQTPHEVFEYAKEAGLGLALEEAKRFFNTFEGNGWHDKDGKPVRDWHNLLAVWAKGEKPKTVSAQQYKQRDYTESDLEYNELLEELKADYNKGTF